MILDVLCDKIYPPAQKRPIKQKKKNQLGSCCQSFIVLFLALEELGENLCLKVQGSLLQWLFFPTLSLQARAYNQR